MHVQLSDIASVRSGIYGKVMPAGRGTIRYIQGGDFKEGVLSPLSPFSSMIEDEGKDQKHYLKENDILFASKGAYNYAAVYHLPEKYHPAVASSSFLILQLFKIAPVLPGYLCWYLNHPQTLKTLQLNSKGTSIQSISKADIQNIEMDIPSIKRQELIIKTAALLEQERILQNSIYDLKKHLLMNSTHEPQ